MYYNSRYIREWDKNYIPSSEKDLYSLAKDHRFIFPMVDHVGDFSKDEIDEIASYPPIVNYHTYKKYRVMSYDKLLSCLPHVQKILEEGFKVKPSYEDLFFYVNRRYIPEYDSLNDKLDRNKIYLSLSSIGKDLINTLYSNDLEYIMKGGKDNMENVIIAYDNHMSDDSLVRKIAENINIIIPEDELASVAFYMLLKDKLENQ